MIFKYYNFLIESTRLGLQEHYLIGFSILIIICIIISAIIISRVREDESVTAVFSTTMGSFVISLAWPFILFILCGIVLPLAIIGGAITALTYIARHVKKYTSTKEEKIYPEEKKTC